MTFTPLNPEAIEHLIRMARTQKIEGNYWTNGRTEYPTIFEALEDNRILKIERSDAGFILTEGCDEYFDIALTPEQLTMLGRELIEMANEWSRNER
jgi:hypothetical protein